jgi:hypothetical protein
MDNQPTPQPDEDAASGRDGNSTQAGLGMVIIIAFGIVAAALLAVGAWFWL